MDNQLTGPQGPKQLSRKITNRLTISDAVKCVTIRTLVIANGEQITLEAIIEVVNHGLNQFTSENTMNEIQTAQFAKDFLNFWDAESLEDLIITFQLARNGQFGKVHNRIDSSVIFNWFREYLELKVEERERQHNNQKEISKKSIINEIKGGKKKAESDALAAKWWPLIKEEIRLGGERLEAREAGRDIGRNIGHMANLLKQKTNSELKAMIEGYESYNNGDKGIHKHHYSKAIELMKAELNSRT